MAKNKRKSKKRREQIQISSAMHSVMPSTISVKSLEGLFKSSSGFQKQEKRPIRIKEELAEREKLKNVDIEQDIRLKKLTLIVLLCFLSVETIIIFGFAFLQATRFLDFKLEEWSFRLLVSATITQIYLMLRIAVEYLFPKNK